MTIPSSRPALRQSAARSLLRARRFNATLAQGEGVPFAALADREGVMREAGVITSQAVLIAIGIDWEQTARLEPEQEIAPARSALAVGELDRQYLAAADRRDLAEARRDLAAWLAKWSAKYSKLTSWGRRQYRRDAHLLSPAAPAP
jgi:hypothetical protein